MSATHTPLNQRSLSLDHQDLIDLISNQQHILIIQDLDGVCMKLVKDPLTRIIDKNYLEATKLFAGHFFVLTNGEHIGKRGVNAIIERTFNNINLVQNKGLYLPGLAGGGVQWQDCHGNISHLGVSEEELTFLQQVPQKIEKALIEFFKQNNCGLEESKIQQGIQLTVLDNKVSPTVNLNIFHEYLQHQEDSYCKLQQAMKILMDDLQEQAKHQGLDNSFFVHYAPNLGKDVQGREIMQIAEGEDSGTTDFQFMLRGAIKEVGVLVILNHYFFNKIGKYPLGKNFNVRQSPRDHQKILKLVKDNFDPMQMPTIIGVGDTVTSKAKEINGKLTFQRGGSDRGFLQLIQEIGKEFKSGNITVYIDSSSGEVKNRKPLKIEKFINPKNKDSPEELLVIRSLGDYRDKDDPLTLNVVFPEGYKQYIEFFKKSAVARHKKNYTN
ncbi:glucosylglycerol 3-phosphatase [cyanobacterium endosymbiont of Epithemia turgida]|uniref:glucosylglycerol 3-phosphatase n=1 Tax=cyanobacterium endosymbiont of Epithemia turgida TaxID=718217 RepID=UPI0004D1637D|nr:glucosylglycerol 3-phosphatase [cyanobacterium endosymbiont of Epithemia turgida]BAP17600.1 glucosylglycerolphosphate phosphatase [cyanobacterium endosymbiont of Epithemia turgida isolate EtSB Lake Yunoko]